MEKFFNKFPTITYSNTACKDLSRRVKIQDKLKRAPNLFYPLELKSGFRADSLADAYYEDPEIEWLIYLSNEIVDPYYQWYLDELEFAGFIATKYGSLEAAQEQTKFYRNNWATDTTEISPAYYTYTLPYDWKSYYTPNYGPGAKIISYSRKPVDHVQNTNQIIRYEYSANAAFVNAEILDIKFGGEIVGGGEVVTANDTVVYIQHVSGNTTANTTAGKELIGETSGTIANTANGEVIYEVITDSESRFWNRVSMYDWEVEQNEAKKHIYVMDKSYTLEVATQLRKKMLE